MAKELEMHMECERINKELAYDNLIFNKNENSVMDEKKLQISTELELFKMVQDKKDSSPWKMNSKRIIPQIIL